MNRLIISAHLVAVVMIASGCAPISLNVESVPDSDVSAGRIVSERPVLSGKSRGFDSGLGIPEGRRPMEIPGNFSKGSESPALSARRSFTRHGFVPRRLTCEKAWEIAVTIGRESGLDPALLFGIMRVESTWAVNAVSGAGAVGLMQIMPGPADRLGCGDRLDPLDNARCGVQILSRFLKRYGNDVILGLSAYNAGFGMPTKAQKTMKIPANFSYPENVLRARARFLRWGCASWND